MAHAFGHHERTIVTVSGSHCSAENNGAEVRIQAGLLAFVNDQITREAIDVGLDKEIAAG